MDAEGFPHIAPGCRAAGGGYLTVKVVGYWLVDGGFTKLRFRGTLDLVRHGIGGWRSFAAEAGQLRRAVWREDCRCDQCHSRNNSSIFSCSLSKCVPFVSTADTCSMTEERNI